MTPEQTKAAIEVMQAYVDGKTVEVSNSNVNNWMEVAGTISPVWNWDEFRYRIKPEPRTIWVNEYGGSDVAHKTEEDAWDGARPQAVRTAVKYVEVTD